MKFIVALTAVALGLHAVHAVCPNSCSGHGTCGENDQCNCHSNFMGGDCSQRVCMYSNAWATSPQGDLNFDGDIYDGTQYSNDYIFTQASAYLATDAAPGGTWEWWPSHHSQSYDEGHFYMECSNQGLCDRSTGLCTCFAGYEGEACRRRTCPNQCSGHGVCLTVSQWTADEGLYTYNLWDADMARTCKCDAGYSGSDCSLRLCPKGDDPLTTGHAVDEVQWIDIYSTVHNASGPLGGYAKFTFTDVYGEAWETDPVDIVTYDGSTTADDVATDLETALKGIPNDVIPSVTVSAGYCEKVLPGKFGNFDAGNATADAYNSGTNPSDYLRCPAHTIAGKDAGNLVVNAATGLVELNGFTGDLTGLYDTTAVDATPAISNSDVTCNSIVYPQCIRLKIEFTHNPGNLNDMSVDVTQVTLNGLTNDQDSSAGIAASVTDTLTLVDDSTATFGYSLTSGETVQSTNNTGTITVGTKTISFGDHPSTTGVTFPINSQIQLYCTQGGSEHNLGIYTVGATSTAAADIVTTETIVNDNGYCASDGDGVVKVQKVTHYLDTNVDLTNENLVGLVPYLVAFNETQEAMTTVDSVQYPAAGAGHIFMTDTSSLSTSVASGVTSFQLKGSGTKEAVECGDRGLCDRDTGECKCFKGYTGASCSDQNALVA